MICQIVLAIIWCWQLTLPSALNINMKKFNCIWVNDESNHYSLKVVKLVAAMSELIKFPLHHHWVQKYRTLCCDYVSYFAHYDLFALKWWIQYSPYNFSNCIYKPKILWLLWMQRYRIAPTSLLHLPPESQLINGFHAIVWRIGIPSKGEPVEYLGICSKTRLQAS